jgi:hypothetical protein
MVRLWERPVRADRGQKPAPTTSTSHLAGSLAATVAVRYYAVVNTSRTHDWIDARSLALARATAEKLRRDPARFVVVIENLQRWRQQMQPWPAALQEWADILTQGQSAAIAALTEDSERGRRLRQSNPFAGVLTPQERNTIFTEYEARAA